MFKIHTENKNENYKIISSGYGGSTLPTIIESNQNLQEDNDVTMIGRGKGY